MESYYSRHRERLLKASKEKRENPTTGEAMRAYGRTYWREHGYKYRKRVKPLTRIRSGAKARGIPFDLVELPPTPSVCPILGIPLTPDASRWSPGKPTVDRIDNRKGYVPGNVAVISRRANELKGALTLEEARAIVRYMAQSLDPSVVN